MLNLYTSGYTSSVNQLDPMILRDEQRSAESGVILLPRDTSHDNNETIVFTPYKNYTVDMKMGIIVSSQVCMCTGL